MPLSKVDCFRSLVEETGYRLTNRQHLFDIIPFILSEEEDRLNEELANRDLSVAFDGTTRLGEALAVVVQLINDDWSIQQRLIQLKLLSLWRRIGERNSFNHLQRAFFKSCCCGERWCLSE